MHDADACFACSFLIGLSLLLHLPVMWYCGALLAGSVVRSLVANVPNAFCLFWDSTIAEQVRNPRATIRASPAAPHVLI